MPEDELIVHRERIKRAQGFMDKAELLEAYDCLQEISDIDGFR